MFDLGKRLRQVPLSLLVKFPAGSESSIEKLANLASFIAELSSGPKGRNAEPHNYRARIEIRKTMRLSFHGHRG